MRCPWRLQVLLFSLGLSLGLALVAGCHREVENVPLETRKIYITDRFFDVQALSAERAIVVGYGGKILLTNDGGRTWELQASGTQEALYSVHFVDADNGWISGQEGLILHTDDGGKTWRRQVTGTRLYLFAVSFLDKNRGWAVGDRATLLETNDGGQHWKIHKLAQTKGLTAEEAIASQDPVLYDVQFLDQDYGWVVGEFGKIYHTSDGGKTFAEQEESLLGHGVFDVLDIPTFFGVHFNNRQEGVVVGLDGKIARTHDGGTTWRFDPEKLAYPLVDPLYTSVSLADGNAWAVGAAGEVLKLDPGATEWHRAKLGMEVFTWLRSIDFFSPQNGWIVGGFGMILHTTDGGKTWLPALG